MEVIIYHNGNTITSTESTWRVDISKLQPPFHSLSVSIPFDNQIGCVDYLNEFQMFPLSNKFIHTLNNKGYKLVAKLGRGGSCVAYLSYEIDKLVTILIRDCETDDNITLDEDRTISTVTIALPDYNKYLNKVYNTIYIDTSYSNNTTYRKLSANNFRHRPILVLEYLPMDIVTYLLSVDVEKRQVIRDSLYKFILEARAHFRDYNMEYIDFYYCNIMVGINNDTYYFKLVDIQGMNIGVLYESVSDDNIRDIVNKLAI